MNTSSCSRSLLALAGLLAFGGAEPEAAALKWKLFGGGKSKMSTPSPIPIHTASGLRISNSGGYKVFVDPHGKVVGDSFLTIHVSPHERGEVLFGELSQHQGSVLVDHKGSASPHEWLGLKRLPGSGAIVGEQSWQGQKEHRFTLVDEHTGGEIPLKWKDGTKFNIHPFYGVTELPNGLIVGKLENAYLIDPVKRTVLAQYKDISFKNGKLMALKQHKGLFELSSDGVELDQLVE